MAEEEAKKKDKEEQQVADLQPRVLSFKARLLQMQRELVDEQVYIHACNNCHRFGQALH